MRYCYANTSRTGILRVCTNPPRIPRVASWRVDRGICGTCHEARNARNAHGICMRSAPRKAAEGRGRPRKVAEGRGRSRKVGVIQSAQQGTIPGSKSSRTATMRLHGATARFVMCSSSGCVLYGLCACPLCVIIAHSIIINAMCAKSYTLYTCGSLHIRIRI